LVVVAVVVDLDTADRAASVVGAVVALCGTVLTVYQVLSAGGAAPGIRARGARAVAAGGSISGNAVGARSRVVGSGAGPAPGSVVADGAVEASGDGALAAGQSVTGNAIGDDSELS
jgi:hypothetical protein